MKTIFKLALIVITTAALFGCGTTAKRIAQMSQSDKADVFAEVKGDEPIPKGFVGLIIRANIKTHVEGYYILESKESQHGKQSYPFLVNIDGQAVRWEVNGIRDSKPKYDKDGTSRDPEAGEGMKYAIDRKLRLRVGSHKVFFGLPEDSYSTEVKITLTEGARHVLEFKPIYRTKRIPTRIPTFLQGIVRYEVVLDSVKVN